MKKKRKYPTVYQRIIRQSRKGGGMKLSPEDVANLAWDDAIATVAYDDDEEQEGRARGTRGLGND